MEMQVCPPIFYRLFQLMEEQLVVDSRAVRRTPTSWTKARTKS